MLHTHNRMEGGVSNRNGVGCSVYSCMSINIHRHAFYSLSPCQVMSTRPSTPQHRLHLIVLAISADARALLPQCDCRDPLHSARAQRTFQLRSAPQSAENLTRSGQIVKLPMLLQFLNLDYLH